MAQNHAIGFINLQVRAPRRADGFAIQQEISQWFWTEFLPVLDELLSELAPDGELIRLDQLDLQLPPLHPLYWRQELTMALGIALRERLERLTRYPGISEAGVVERVPLAQGHFEAWLRFLEHGNFPLQYAGAREEDRLRAVLENVAVQTGALNRLRELLRQSPRALQRLVLQHETVFLTQLASAITGQTMATLPGQPAALHRVLSGAPLRDLAQPFQPGAASPIDTEIPFRRLETRFWQKVFETLADETQSFDAQTFAEKFFETQFSESFQRSFQTALQHAARRAEPDDMRRSDFARQLDQLTEQASGSEPLRAYFQRETEALRQKPATPAPAPVQEKTRDAHKPEAPAGEDGPERPLPDKSHLETWLWFLQNGGLPRNPAAGTLVERLAAVLGAVAREPDAAQQLSRLIRHQPKALQRLVLEHDIAFLKLLAEAITGKNLDWSPEMPAVLYKALTGAAMQGLAKQALPPGAAGVLNAIVVPETSFEIWYWQELLVAAAGEAQNFADQTFVTAFFKRAFALIYKIPYAEFVGQSSRAAAASEKQRAAILRKLELLQRHFARTEALQAFFQQELEPLREQLQTASPQTAAEFPHAEALAAPMPAPDQMPATATGYFAAWTWFLQYGHLPPGHITGNVPETTRLKAVLEALSTRPAAMKSLRRLLQRQAPALDRLILQHQPGFLADLAPLLAGQPLPHLPGLADAVYSFLASATVQDLVYQALPHDDRFLPSPIAARQLERWFWQELFAVFVGSAKNFNYQNFVRGFFHWSFQRVFKMPFPDWVLRAAQFAAPVGKKRAAIQRLIPAVVQKVTENEVLRLFILEEWEPVFQRLRAPQADAGPTRQPVSDSLADAQSPESGGAVSAETQRIEPPVPEEAAPPTKPTAPPPDRTEREKPAPEAPKAQYLPNAGLVLLHPFLVSLFEAAGITQKKEFADEEARTRAVQLLHYLATGSVDAPEYALGMPKFLCGMPHGMPVDRQSLLSEQDRVEGETMMQAAIRHWGALGQVSNDSLREGFLQREGKLSRRDTDWLLQMESKTIDILIGRLPWGLGVVKLPWMPEMLHVEWY